MKKRGLIKVISLLSLLVVGSTSLYSCNESKEDDTNKDDDTDDDISKISYIKGDDSHLKEEEKQIEKVRFHYHRLDNNDTYSNYKNWHMWCWDITNGGSGAWYEYTHYDDFGVYVDVNLADVKIASASSISSIGFIVAKGEWSSKDPDGDRSVDVSGTAPGGILDCYLISGQEKVYDDSTNALKTSISSARVSKDSFSQIELYFTIVGTFEFDESKVTVLVDNAVSEIDSITKVSSSHYTIVLKEACTLTSTVQIKYQFDDNYADIVDVVAIDYFDSDEFENNYYYDGEDLGVTFDDETNTSKTTFKLWAPTSKSVTLKIYNSGDYLTDLTSYKEVEMTLEDKGVWSTQIEEDLNGKYYTYIVTNQKGTNEVVDPYAKSCGVNGKRGMIVNFTKLNEEIDGWNSDTRPEYGESGVDASIYEMHIRDMTINPNSGVSEVNRGKYLGLTEENTVYEKDGKSVTTGLSHLKELGITHVQIQPFFDYSSVDETSSPTSMSKTNYNWGYDPQNYNCLEGSYSSNPNDGKTRIIEFKKMVMALHNSGININMDVVYNHTASSEQSNFNLIVPYYYYRTSSDGKFLNGSGCGNEIASQRKMVRKFILDSTTFWTKEYHLSGFRFDLMGLEDNQTMIDVYNENKKIYSNILVYGEPWDMGNLNTSYLESNLDNQKTLQGSLGQSYFAGSKVYVGAFNDVIRNATRGDNTPQYGWVQGLTTKASSLKPGIKGLFKDISSTDLSVEPEQVLNYVSCHDNYTLYDQLIQTNVKNRDLSNMYSQAEALIFTSQGVPFMQEGEDFMRSKSYESSGKTLYEGNSYNVGDYINNMDYSLKLDNLDMFENFKDLISVRKENSELRLSSREEIDNKFGNITVGSVTGNIDYEIDSSLRVIHGLNASSVELDGTYNVLYSNVDMENKDNLEEISLINNQTVVLKKVQ